MAAGSLSQLVTAPAGWLSRWRHGRRRFDHAGTGLAMILPAAIFFAVFLIYPVLNAFWVSLTSWDLVSVPRFVGLNNYRLLLDDDDFKASLLISIVYTFGTLVIELPLSLLLATLLDRRIRARGFYQAVIFTPVVLSVVAVSMIWRAVYAPVGGLYLMFTAPFGVNNLQWLNSATLAMPALIIVAVWKNVGYYMVVFLAGLQSIPKSLYEAARIDGAGAWRLFRFITLPLLRPYLLFVVVVSIIRTMQSFSAVYTLTDGGPAGATKVLPYLIYENAFSFNRMGYASAIAVVMFCGLLALTAVQFRLLRDRSIGKA